MSDGRIVGRARIALSAALAVAPAAWGQEQEQEQESPKQPAFVLPPPPQYRLEPVPQVALEGAAFADDGEETAEIRDLIASLTGIDKPDYGLAPWMSGQQFAPVTSTQTFDTGILGHHGLVTSSAVERLVAFGPKAIPALLKALDDAAPTRLTFQQGGMGGMWHGRELQVNPALEREVRVRQEHPEFAEPGRGLGRLDEHIERYEVTRGDICFVILGQIVNRNYQAVRYQPTACRVINSPSADPLIASAVREIWRSDDPARMLLDSLLADLCTRDDTMHASTPLQCGAATRLLYYFPRQAAGLIARRIENFDAGRIVASDQGWTAAYQARHATNGVPVDEFIKAVAFSAEPEIQRAVAGVLARSDDPMIVQECLSAPIAAANPDLVLTRARAILSTPPPAEQGPFGGEDLTLRKVVHLLPEHARPLAEQYAAHGTLACLRATIHALTRPEVSIPWAADYLRPHLEDRTATGWEYGPEFDRHPIRVCDEAATALAAHVPEIRFETKGTHEDLDRQIENIRRYLAGERGIDFTPEAEPTIAGDVPARHPVSVLSFEESIGSVFTISDLKTLSIGHGYQGRSGWAYETLVVDAATGDIRRRVPLGEWNCGVNILRPMRGPRILCYMDGAIIERDVWAGADWSRVETPFHDGIGFDDPLQIRNLGDITVTSDGRWALAITPDHVLHSIDLRTGAHVEEWRYEGPVRFKHGLGGRVIPVRGRNAVLVESVPDPMDSPLRLWDHDLRVMTEIDRVPGGGWHEAWGDLAWNHTNGIATVWNLAMRVQVVLPRPPGGEPIAEVLCDSDQAALFALRPAGWIDVYDLKTRQAVARLLLPEPAAARATIEISDDDGVLFWQSHRLRDQPAETARIAIFSVADLTR